MSKVYSCILLMALAGGVGAEGFAWPEGKEAALSLSFDDGHQSQIEVAAPLLDEFGVKGTFYVLPFRVDDHLQGWRGVAGRGHEIGNHSMGHPCTGNFAWAREDRVELEAYDLERMRGELLRANAFIEERLGVRPVSFAYPCGQTFVGRGRGTASYVPLVAELFASGRRWLDESDNDPLFFDPAQVLALRMDGQEFGQIRPLVEEALGRGRWLVLAGHRVGPARQYSTGAGMLRQLLDHAREHWPQLWIAPVGAVAAHVAARRGAGD